MQTIARCNGRIVAGKLRFPTSYYQKLISKLRVQQVNPFLQQVNPFLQQVNISGEKLEDYILSSARDYFGMRGL